MAFIDNTRRKIVPLPSQSRTGTGGATMEWQLPKAGFLARIYLLIRGGVIGSGAAMAGKSALGKASFVRRVQLKSNSSLDLIDLSGAGYHYLLRDQLESSLIDGGADTDARSDIGVGAVAPGTPFNLDMVLPVAINLRDPMGLVLLQNEMSQFTLSVETPAISDVATQDATFTSLDMTVTPYLEIFSVPQDRKNWPPIEFVHTLQEDAMAIAGAGEVSYAWPRGNTYLQLIHGCGIGAAGSDNFTRVLLRTNHTDTIETYEPHLLDRVFYYQKGRARAAGVVPFDEMASSGLGNYGLTRDFINSRAVTDIETVITASGVGTLYTVRRQLVVLGK